MMIDKETNVDGHFGSILITNQRTLKIYKSLFVLDHVKIKIPQQMINAILKNGKNNVGNKVIVPLIADGEYRREICGEL